MKLLLLLCLGLTLVCAHQGGSHGIVTSNIDTSKISGEWYTIFLASDQKERIEENGSLRLLLEYIQPLENSSLFLVYHKKVNGECTELTFIYDETEEKDVYGVTYKGYNLYHIEEAVYNDYFIFNVLNINDKKKTRLTGFNARKPDVSAQHKKRFEEHCQNLGIPKENIVDLTKADRCLQARGSHGDQASSSIQEVLNEFLVLSLICLFSAE